MTIFQIKIPITDDQRTNPDGSTEIPDSSEENHRLRPPSIFPRNPRLSIRRRIPVPQPHRRGHIRRRVPRQRQTHRRDSRAETPENGKGKRGIPHHVPPRNQHSTQRTTPQHRNGTLIKKTYLTAVVLTRATSRYAKSSWGATWTKYSS